MRPSNTTYTAQSSSGWLPKAMHLRTIQDCGDAPVNRKPDSQGENMADPEPLIVTKPLPVRSSNHAPT